MESPTAHARAALLPSAEPYELRATLAYWTSVVWLEASVAFTAASFFMLFSDRWEAEKVTALVNAPFVMGAALFTVGAYVGILSALNAQHPPHTPLRLWPRPSELRVVPGLWGYFVYFVGTLWFLWNCIAGLVGVSGGRLGALEVRTLRPAQAGRPRANAAAWFARAGPGRIGGVGVGVSQVRRARVRALTCGARW